MMKQDAKIVETIKYQLVELGDIRLSGDFHRQARPRLKNKGDGIMQPKRTELKILKKMMKNPKRSDREIATNAKVSQPTVSRTRNRLEEKGVIESYQIIPNLRALGFEIIAFSVIPNGTIKEEVVDDPRIIWCLNTDRGILYVSIHRSFSDFQAFSQSAPIQVLTTTRFDQIKSLSFAKLMI